MPNYSWCNMTELKNFTEWDEEQKFDNEYSECSFRNCDFSKHNFNEIKFTDCIFETCNLTMSKVESTELKGVTFKNCKLMGIDFSKLVDTFLSVSFDTCILQYSNFFGLNLTKTKFTNCIIHDASFIETNLKSAQFANCDFKGAVFQNCNLEKADFLTSMNYSINPEYNKIKKAKFSIPEIIGLLSHLDIIIK